VIAQLAADPKSVLLRTNSGVQFAVELSIALRENQPWPVCHYLCEASWWSWAATVRLNAASIRWAFAIAGVIGSVVRCGPARGQRTAVSSATISAAGWVAVTASTDSPAYRAIASTSP